jgi:hypothetical protein
MLRAEISVKRSVNDAPTGMIKNRFLQVWVAVVICSGICRAGELRDLKVLYIGNPKVERAAAFKTFLEANFAHVGVEDRLAFDFSRARNFDVVLVDWPQSESRETFPPRKSPLGPLRDWTTPTVLLGSAGLHLAIVWDVKGGFG